MQPSAVNQDPYQGEFFTTEEIDLPLRLVRESIQNSLDAMAPDNDQVQIKFVLSGEGPFALSSNVASKYHSALKRHLNSINLPIFGDDGTSSLQASELLKEPMSYLIIEDFGTTGLQGEVEANSQMEKGNDFWGLFRSVGITPKDDDSGGSWGLGKWVFPDASMINCFFGITCRREDDEVNKLMGMTFLQTHQIESKKFPPYGWYAKFSSDPDECWLPMPIESDDEILQFCEDFEISDRICEPGLSIVVPYPNKELQLSKIEHAVISQYFLPIVNGRLHVQIYDKNSREQREINADSISKLISNLPSTETDEDGPYDTNQELMLAVELAQFARQCLKRNDFIEIDSGNADPRKLVFKDLESLQAKYENGMKLAFKVGINVRHRINGNSVNEFYVFLKKNLELKQGIHYYVRENLRIPGVRPTSNHQVESLVLIDGSTELGHMLRDAEGPSHEKWNKSSSRLKENWIVGKRVDFVRDIIDHLLRNLQPRTDKLNFGTLAHIFPRTASINPSPSPKPDTPPDTPTPPDVPIPPIPSNPIHFNISRSGSELFVKNTNNPVEERTEWKLQFAYGLAYERSGDPFSIYANAYKNGYPDFSLDDGSIQIVSNFGCVIKNSFRNEIHFTVTKESFEIRLSGFDNRDLTTRIDSN